MFASAAIPLSLVAQGRRPPGAGPSGQTGRPCPACLVEEVRRSVRDDPRLLGLDEVTRVNYFESRIGQRLRVASLMFGDEVLIAPAPQAARCLAMNYFPREYS